MLQNDYSVYLQNQCCQKWATFCQKWQMFFGKKLWQIWPMLAARAGGSDLVSWRTLSVYGSPRYLSLMEHLGPSGQDVVAYLVQLVDFYVP